MDRGLVEAAQQGDHDAFEALMMGAADRLYAIARLLLRDSERARDAVQETMVHAWRSLPSLREPERFDAWLHRLTVNACADQARKERRWSADIRAIDREPSAEDGSSHLAERDLIERGFRRLNHEQRAVVVLRFYLDQTVPEMARTLGIPQGTVKSRLHHSIAALRAALEPEIPRSQDSLERTA